MNAGRHSGAGFVYKGVSQLTKAEKLVAWASSELGSPYIFGAAGQKCTPAYRCAVMGSKPEYAEAIARNCPVVSGKQATCTGCRYAGKRAYDCRGLTREGMHAVTGRSIMGAGATSQWNDNNNWAAKGDIQSLPRTPCIVFVRKGNTMSHTGIFTGSSVIHASGHNTGVIDSPMPRSWTHFAVPVGLYEGEEETMADEYLLRRRDINDKVRTLQQGLLRLGYDLGDKGTDGNFGSKTEVAVRKFQEDNALPVDAVWDSDCQAVLKERLAALSVPTVANDVLVTVDAILLILAAHRGEVDKTISGLQALRTKV